ncbi:MAG: phosphoenolpyruvate--protein phosphotransferase [Acetobacteraceae bacterium]|nr:phosphoenolpyruvate--protein phosphotransferase [Acetobacteraceae bacterium]
MSRTSTGPGFAEAAAPGCPAPRERRLSGIPTCPGVAIGPLFMAEEPVPEIGRQRIQAADIEAERTRLDEAVARSRKQLHKLRGRLALLPGDTQAEIAPLLDAYLHMLGPSRLLRGAQSRIAERLVAAETAISEEAHAVAAAIATLGASSVADDDGSTARQAAARQAEEVREIARRIVRNLTRAPFRSFVQAPQGAILVAESLRPSDVALINPARIAGVVTEEGGASGHAAILLRALDVPAVLGVPGLLAAVRSVEGVSDGASSRVVVIEGGEGLVVLHPEAATITEARHSLLAYARERQRLGRLRRLPAETLDGQSVELHANLELPAELPMIARSGCSGIGLVRTEFLFMNRETLPGEDEQADIYRAIVEAMGGEPVTIRVLDWGGEKEIDALVSAGVVPEAADLNPALGLRGIRFLLREESLFEVQLAAILRAAVAGPVRVLLPMVTNAAEIRAAKAVYRRVAAQVQARGVGPSYVPPLGTMIETPAAALAADSLAQEAGFFALGTNDLAMYALAVDRAEAAVATLYDPLHPAVLRLVQFATEAALRRRIPVSVCGEMAGNARFTPLLLGLGLRSFSMAASAVPLVKQAIRGTATEDCIRLAWTVMQSEAERIPELIEAFGR